uniref:Secreted protein n=1 Tax=Parastrongyloides trichosuri TaxID=131310 RepID=A0A0N4ZAN1_PARTI
MKFIFYYLASLFIVLYTSLVGAAPPVTNTKVIVIKTTSTNSKGPMRAPSPRRGRSPPRRAPSPPRRG